MPRRLPQRRSTGAHTAACALLVIPLSALSSCAIRDQAGATQQGSDLGWLWGLLVVIALFVLGTIAYKLRNPKKRSDPNAAHAPEGRIVVQRGRKKLNRSGPYDYGPRVPDDPSSVPKFYHHGPGA